MKFSRCGWVAAGLGCAAWLGLGCAKVPRDRYGIDRIRFEGTKQMSEQALQTCLATQERETFALNPMEFSCGEPPFDRRSLRLRLWRWPWNRWPLYDQSVLERDLSRIERWYRARGFYDAKVAPPRLQPPAAARSDEVDEETECQRLGKRQGCKVQIELSVEEGLPVRVEQVALDGIDGLPAEVQKELWQGIQLHLGDRFDETLYDRSKEALIDLLAEVSYARAVTSGQVVLDPIKRTAGVFFTVVPGPSCVLGRVRVEGQGSLPLRPIVATADLITGSIYRQSEIVDAQRAVYALGAFSSVSIEPQMPKDPKAKVIDIVVRVTPGRRFRYGFGFGVQSGRYVGFQGDVQGEDVPQWDVHLLGVFEDRNFLGGIRRLRTEVRPRLIFNNNFPRPSDNCCSQPFNTNSDPVLGALTTVDFRQPSFLEARTTLVADARLDLGPDPFFQQGGYYRLDLDARVGPERYFFNGKLYLYGGIHGNLLQQINDAQEVPSDYRLMFLEQQIRVDLRDDAIEPHKGAFFAISMHEGGFVLSSWKYLRITPEARAYIPLPSGMVLATRFGLGAMFIFGTDCDGLPDPSQCRLNDVSNSDDLGPFRYRIRGGGPSSNRGFPTGQLGAGPPGVDGLDGGLRRWEASIELRARLTKSLGLAVFWDFGDVNQGKNWRFDYLNTTFGAGLRWRTLVGPLRLDVGWLIPRWRVVGGPQTPDQFHANLGFWSFPGAIHLTIGEAY